MNQNNNYKPKYTCGDRKSNLRCVFYDLDVPEYSNIYEEDCITGEETTEDIYKLITWIRESIDLEDLENENIDIEKVRDSYKRGLKRYLVKDILIDLNQRLQNLESEEDDSDTMSLDFKCLVTSCGDPISSLKDLLQALIDGYCELKSK